MTHLNESELNAEHVKFSSLKIGDTFDWIGPYPTFYESCKKISARRYTDGKHTYTVGSVNAHVYHVNQVQLAA